MSDPTDSGSTGPTVDDESAFGAGGQTSQQADENSATDDNDVEGGPVSGAGNGSADENVADSQSADVAAGYDDPADAPQTDDAIPSTADDGTPLG